MKVIYMGHSSLRRQQHNAEKRLKIQWICKITEKGNQNYIKLAKSLGWWEGKNSEFLKTSL